MERASALLIVSLFLVPCTRADLLVYEGFDYAVGSDINTPLNGGTGFSDGWTAGQQGGVVTVYDAAAAVGVTNGNAGGEIEWDGVVNNVPTTPSPNRYVATGTSGADRITADRTLSQDAGTLAGADSVLWASVVWHQQGSNYGRHVGFSLGTDGQANRSVNIDGGGNGIGVGGAFNTGLVTPTIWNSGNIDVRTTTGATSVSYSLDNLVVLKFEFGATDTVTAYTFTETDTLSEATFNSSAVSATSTIDESTLTVLSFSQSRGQEAIDEIRLGDTFDDVTTGLISPPVELPFQITDITRNPLTEEVTLTWNSTPGEFYGLYWSEDLAEFSPGIDPAIPAHPSDPATTYGPFTSPMPGADHLFFRVGPPDLEDPVLESSWGNGSTITLAFSEALLAGPATNLGNYTVTENGVGPVTVTDVVLSGDGTTVELTVSTSLGLGTAYTVATQNLTDLAGRAVAAPGSSEFQTWDNDPNGIQVFILAGQSNMVGYGKTEQGGNPAWTPENGEAKEITGGLGCLRYLANNNGSFPEYDYTSLLVDPGQPATSDWAVRSDVKVWWKDGYVDATRNIRKGNLGPPFMGSNSNWFGPEFAFGQVIGDFFDGVTERPVLIIKTAWGGISLGGGFRPPSAVAARGGVLGPYYTAMIEDVREALSNLATEFPAALHPEFDAAGYRYRIAGIGWHQGWNDGGEPFASEYKDNLPDLISDLRAEFGNPSLPFAIATTGMGGNKPVEPSPYTGYGKVEQAQLWVAGVAQPAEVLSNDTRPCWRDASIAPSTLGYHWNHSGESYFLVGKGLGDDMETLLSAP